MILLFLRKCKNVEGKGRMNPQYFNVVDIISIVRTQSIVDRTETNWIFVWQWKCCNGTSITNHSNPRYRWANSHVTPINTTRPFIDFDVIAFTWAFSPRNLVTLTFTFGLFIYRSPRAPGTLVSEVNETDLSHVNASWLAARVPQPEN